MKGPLDKPPKSVLSLGHMFDGYVTYFQYENRPKQSKARRKKKNLFAIDTNLIIKLLLKEQKKLSFDTPCIF